LALDHFGIDCNLAEFIHYDGNFCPARG
jgi:hypothetical protein